MGWQLFAKVLHANDYSLIISYSHLIIKFGMSFLLYVYDIFIKYHHGFDEEMKLNYGSFKGRLGWVGCVLGGLSTSIL